MMTIRQTRQYRSYEEYVTHQKLKTEDAVRRRKWLGAEWNLKLNGFIGVYQAHWDLISGCKEAICLGSRTGQEVQALIDLGIRAVGIDLVPCDPLVKQGDIHHIPYPSDCFGFAFTNVFDHSLDPARFVAEIERVLRPGGVCIAHLQVAMDGDEFTVSDVDNAAAVCSLFKCSQVLANRAMPLNFAAMNWEVVARKNESREGLAGVQTVSDLHSRLKNRPLNELFPEENWRQNPERSFFRAMLKVACLFVSCGEPADAVDVLSQVNLDCFRAEKEFYLRLIQAINQNDEAALRVLISQQFSSTSESKMLLLSMLRCKPEIQDMLCRSGVLQQLIEHDIGLDLRFIS